METNAKASQINTSRVITLLNYSSSLQKLNNGYRRRAETIATNTFKAIHEIGDRTFEVSEKEQRRKRVLGNYARKVKIGISKRSHLIADQGMSGTIWWDRIKWLNIGQCCLNVMTL